MNSNNLSVIGGVFFLALAIVSMVNYTFSITGYSVSENSALYFQVFPIFVILCLVCSAWLFAYTRKE